MDILSVAVFRNAKLAHVGESRASNTSTTKNRSKFDRGRGHLPGGTKPLLPQRRRICVDGNAEVHILNFGIGRSGPTNKDLFKDVPWKLEATLRTRRTLTG